MSTTLYVRVPVQWVNIVNGPGKTLLSILGISDEITEWTGRHTVRFQIQSNDIRTRLEQNVTMTDIWTNGTYVAFVGVYGTEKIRGEYNLHLREGKFSHIDNPDW